MGRVTIDAVDVRGKRVFMRVDFNVPIEQGRITDDRRITQALPSIRSVVDRGGRLVLASHLGRPDGTGHEAAYCLRPVADRLAGLLPGVPIVFAEGSCAGAEARGAIDGLADGGVVLLDNLRFERGEKKGDAAFAARLAEGMDIYCNDAFGTAHRNDASMYAVPCAMAGRPRVAGFLLEKELRFLSDAIASAGPGFVAVLGGAKVSDKLKVVSHLLTRVDEILVGGAMAYTFLAASGLAVGASRVESGMLEPASRALAGSREGRARLRLPVDHHAASAFSADAARRVEGPGIAEGWMGLDIGPATIAAYSAAVAGARTVVWNGPMGVFEMPPFDAGTRAIATAMVTATERGATTIVGGGDSAAAIERFGLADRVSHVSTGGGASLEMLEGRTFDSVELLDRAP
ncbi:MAG: phosphoglycerate kinase [Phycisphaeraceae bacterium]|nr:phosphoglycerate kinase [Phycisphaeraceae bacterium]